jgi:hypothetical protein
MRLRDQSQALEKMNEAKGGTAQSDSVTLVGYFEIKLEGSMTSLDKKVTRKVEGLLKNGIAVTLYPSNVIGLREVRCRKEYILPVMTIYKMAILADQASEKARKKAEHKAKFGK